MNNHIVKTLQGSIPGLVTITAIRRESRDHREVYETLDIRGYPEKDDHVTVGDDTYHVYGRVLNDDNLVVFWQNEVVIGMRVRFEAYIPKIDPCASKTRVFLGDKYISDVVLDGDDIIATLS